jgi:hypothetical protein
MIFERRFMRTPHFWFGRLWFVGKRSLLNAVAMTRLGCTAIGVTAMAFSRAFIAGVGLAFVGAITLSRFHLTRALVMSAFHDLHLKKH